MAKFVCGCGICGKRIMFKDIEEYMITMVVREDPKEAPAYIDVVMCDECKMEYNNITTEKDTMFYNGWRQVAPEYVDTPFSLEVNE